MAACHCSRKRCDMFYHYYYTLGDIAPGLGDIVIDSPQTNHSNSSPLLLDRRWVSRSSGGWTIVGAAAAKANASEVLSNLTAQGGATTAHAVLTGVSGEPHARLAIETSGEVFFGNGHDMHFHTVCAEPRLGSLVV